MFSLNLFNKRFANMLDLPTLTGLKHFNYGYKVIDYFISKELKEISLTIELDHDINVVTDRYHKPTIPIIVSSNKLNLILTYKDNKFTKPYRLSMRLLNTTAYVSNGSITLSYGALEKLKNADNPYMTYIQDYYRKDIVSDAETFFKYIDKTRPRLYITESNVALSKLLTVLYNTPTMSYKRMRDVEGFVYVILLHRPHNEDYTLLNEATVTTMKTRGVITSTISASIRLTIKNTLFKNTGYKHIADNVKEAREYALTKCVREYYKSAGYCLPFLTPREGI